MHHQAHHGARRVELAALLARRVGELSDQVLVGCAEQIGELEVFVAQAVLVEVVDEGAQALVGDLSLAHGAVEVDVVEDALQPRVLLFEGRQRSVEAAADVVVQLVTDVLPAGERGQEEVVVEAGRLGALLRLLWGAALGQLLRDHRSALHLEHV